MNIKRNSPQDWLALAKHANWSVSELARLCGVSRRTLERHFLTGIGQAPKVWLAEHRFKQAIELLRDHSSVKETAVKMGFPHASTFTRWFKKFSGKCPHDLVKDSAGKS